MSSSAANHTGVSALRVKVSRDALSVDLSDGRTIIAPLAWYPRLIHATAKERNAWRLIGRGVGNSLGRCRRGYKCRQSAERPAVGRKPGLTQEMA